MPNSVQNPDNPENSSIFYPSPKPPTGEITETQLMDERFSRWHDEINSANMTTLIALCSNRGINTQGLDIEALRMELFYFNEA